MQGLDSRKLELPPLPECLARAKRQWEAANAIAPTASGWPETEAAIRQKHAELMAMSQEDRDVAILKAQAPQREMLQAVLTHVDGLIIQEKARLAREARERKAGKSKKKGSANHGRRTKKR